MKNEHTKDEECLHAFLEVNPEIKKKNPCVSLLKSLSVSMGGINTLSYICVSD